MNKIAALANRLPVTALLLTALTLTTTACSRFNNNGSLSIWGIAILVLDVLALIDVFRQPWTIGKKILWVAIIWFLPVLGLILYYLLSGRGKSNLA
ncbi:PLD nuclease N-terminal domain-containing protein [Hymenobacter chitinivorans]|uniref:Phospholipase D-like protein n=1 Tax=Hymenobacter chitinivorans DSM 11115 TaxID=1121954 RepID=A0A2M9ARN3_9BACT|nr:PLD nuclease N-terminal domain-containing protein [Hymenobacter chitinivorans]PJJ48349.1 phospholipase D-like protein [Hymenobacter chitinivorans DSM 11115]